MHTPESAAGSLELSYVVSEWASAPPSTLDPATGVIVAETSYGGAEGDLSVFSDVFVVEQASGSDPASHNFYLMTGDEGPQGLFFKEANLYRISQ